MTRLTKENYPVVDLFAGPGGLGEGFSSLWNSNSYIFRPEISIEQDQFAHRTLLLRHFFRCFVPGEVPVEYYRYLSGELPLSDLAEMYPREWAKASDSALHISLGDATHEDVRRRIADRLKGRRKWVLCPTAMRQLPSDLVMI